METFLDYELPHQRDKREFCIIVVCGALISFARFAELDDCVSWLSEIVLTMYSSSVLRCASVQC